MTLRWPSLVIAAVVGAYWLRVLKMVAKAKRRAGHGAGLVPREGLGRALRIVWYPVVALWIALPLLDALGYGAADWPSRPLWRSPAVGWPCAAVASAAFAATWICWRRMGKSWRMGIDPHEKTRLVVTGPYAYVRHPIYALSSVLMLATALAVPTPLMIFVAALHLGLLQWEARREERFLTAIHGPLYADYQSRVGAFLPRSRHPYIPRPRNGA